MLDPNAFDARWTLLLGVPIIAWLIVIACRRTQAVVARIREVRAEMARNPQDPYASLAALMSEDQTKKKETGKHAGRR
ncbi:MAG: hypothetical protein ACRYFS_10760 [Janthinobacterium lividum]